LEIDSESKFTRVRMSNGQEGWIQSQYLITQPIAQDRLREINREHTAIVAKYQQSLLRIQEQDKYKTSTESLIQRLERDNESLGRELAEIRELASSVITINEVNTQLQNERDSLNDEIDELATSLATLKDTSDQDWFLRGAAIILLGMLVGFVVSRSLYGRRVSQWS
jgi:SH3 domain protein